MGLDCLVLESQVGFEIHIREVAFSFRVIVLCTLEHLSTKVSKHLIEHSSQSLVLSFLWQDNYRLKVCWESISHHRFYKQTNSFDVKPSTVSFVKVCFAPSNQIFLHSQLRILNIATLILSFSASNFFLSAFADRFGSNLNSLTTNLIMSNTSYKEYFFSLEAFLKSSATFLNNTTLYKAKSLSSSITSALFGTTNSVSFS